MRVLWGARGAEGGGVYFVWANHVYLLFVSVCHAKQTPTIPRSILRGCRRKYARVACAPSMKLSRLSAVGILACTTLLLLLRGGVILQKHREGVGVHKEDIFPPPGPRALTHTGPRSPPGGPTHDYALETARLPSINSA